MKKVFCKLCKSDVDGKFWRKHEQSTRHLRATAAQIFHDRKKKKPKKDEGDLDIEVPGEGEVSVKREEISTTYGPMQGVWVKVIDEGTGSSWFRNRLSGATTRQKPIGLKETELKIEHIQSYVPKFYGKLREKVKDTGETVGSWEDVEAPYMFGDSEEELKELQIDKEEDIDEVLIEKPLYSSKLSTSSIFKKRQRKGK